MYVRVGGRDGDSQSRVPSATLHVSITFCCPSTCLAGLADVNKIVSPFPTRARAGPPAPYAPKPEGGDWGHGTGTAHASGLRRQCQPTSDLNQDLGTGPAPSPGAEQSDAVRVLDKNLLQSERWHSACVLPASVAPRFPFSPGFAQTVG